MKDKLQIILVFLIFTLIAGTTVNRKIQYKRAIETLLSMDSQQVTIFRVYPRVNLKPSGTPAEFSVSDPIIDEFFQSLADIRSYPKSRDKIASFDHCWFLEVATDGTMIQIGFAIPYKKGDIVVGHIAKGNKTNPAFYGYFQSRVLFKWYQKHSHRWLETSDVQE
jgi:hypothetical protein